MKISAPVLLAPLLALLVPAGAVPEVPVDLPAGPLQLEGRPLRLAAFPGPDGGVDVLLLDGRELGRYRLSGHALRRLGRFRAPVKRARPLLVDARAAAEGEATVTALFGEDYRSVDRGTDTHPHAWVLLADRDGALRPASEDLAAYVAIAGDGVRLQRRGIYALFEPPVLAVERGQGGFLPTSTEIPWASRWLLEATPLPDGKAMLAWDGATPQLRDRGSGARVSGGVMLGDLGTVSEPQIAIRLETPVFKLGLDKEGRVNETWYPVPRRVTVAGPDAAYTIERGRTRGFLGKTSGQDAVVRLDLSEGQIVLARPFPGVDAFVLDFALVPLPDGPPAALLLVNEKEDGSGRAFLVAQRPR